MSVSPFLPDGQEGKTEQIGPLVGWRSWKVTESPLYGLRLQSMYRAVIWQPGKALEAECLQPHGHNPTPFEVLFKGGGAHRKGQVPQKNCSCGIYALKDSETKYVFHLSSFNPSLLGVIEGWGRFVEGEKGFRVQYAKIVALQMPSLMKLGIDSDKLPEVATYNKRVAKVAETYDVPLVESIHKYMEA